MKPRLMAATILVSLLTIPYGAQAQAVLQRFVLIAGANSGGTDRPVLRYAVSDADRFARVMRDLGGVSSPDALVLKEPKVRNLVEALNWLNQRVAEARRAAGPGKGRTEILVYYSGHADEKGLLLGDDRYSYQSLRDRLDEIPADVRIAVLDACASGAFTRLKGGKVHKPFMVDQAMDMQGHAFLTSSAETEAAQESDHLGASYFTHYLISGLRGAADVNTDGKISLNEAYQFAFQETLGRTVNSQGGAQHPSYDIKLSGTGDVTITDVRQTTATLVLAASLEGRIFVRNARQELVVELYKAQGRTVELGLEPGTYEVRIERPAEAWLAKSQVSNGQRLELGLDQFSPTKPEPSRRRGIGTPTYALAGRNRIELRIGMGRASSSSTPTPSARAGAESVDFLVGLQYTRFVREDLAITFGADALPSNSSVVSATGAFSGSRAIVTLPVGIRWNPMKGQLSARAVKPYIALGFGPVIGGSEGSSLSLGSAFAGAQSAATAGGFFGAGVDVLTGRWCSIGVSAGYNLMADFSRPIGGRDNYSGFQVAVGLGLLFGKGYGGRH
jgi:hypothetical protein